MYVVHTLDYSLVCMVMVNMLWDLLDYLLSKVSAVVRYLEPRAKTSKISIEFLTTTSSIPLKNLENRHTQEFKFVQLKYLQLCTVNTLPTAATSYKKQQLVLTLQYIIIYSQYQNQLGLHLFRCILPKYYIQEQHKLVINSC